MTNSPQQLRRQELKSNVNKLVGQIEIDIVNLETENIRINSENLKLTETIESLNSYYKTKNKELTDRSLICEKQLKKEQEHSENLQKINLKLLEENEQLKKIETSELVEKLAKEKITTILINPIDWIMSLSEKERFSFIGKIVKSFLG